MNPVEVVTPVLKESAQWGPLWFTIIIVILGMFGLVYFTGKMLFDTAENPKTGEPKGHLAPMLRMWGTHIGNINMLVNEMKKSNDNHAFVAAKIQDIAEVQRRIDVAMTELKNSFDPAHLRRVAELYEELRRNIDAAKGAASGSMTDTRKVQS